MRNCKVSVFSSVQSLIPTDLEWETVRDAIKNPTAVGGIHWAPARYQPWQRRRENIVALSHVVLDYDGSNTLTDALKAWQGYAGCIHTTKNHTPEVARFRVILELTHDITPAEHKRVMTAIRETKALRSHEWDAMANDVGQIWAMPQPWDHYEFFGLPGDPLDVNLVLCMMVGLVS